MARVAGLLPFMPADAPDEFADYRAPSDFEATYGAASPNALLNQFHVLEGLPRFLRHPVAGTMDFLADPDDLSLGDQLYTDTGDVGGTIAPVRISPPLRWTRASRAVVGGDTDSVFDPPVGTFTGLSGVLGVYVVPGGNHGTEVPNAMKTWEVKHSGRDDANFLDQLQSDPEVAKHFKKGELEKLCSLEFHFKEAKNRFKKLGL